MNRKGVFSVSLVVVCVLAVLIVLVVMLFKDGPKKKTYGQVTQCQLSSATIQPAVFVRGQRIKIGNDTTLEITSQFSRSLAYRGETMYKLTKVDDPTVEFECGQDQITAMLKMPNNKLIETDPKKDDTVNEAEVKAFLNDGGPPPTWQYDGVEWIYTGRKEILGEYWKHLIRLGYRIKAPPQPGSHSERGSQLKAILRASRA